MLLILPSQEFEDAVIQPWMSFLPYSFLFDREVFIYIALKMFEPNIKFLLNITDNALRLDDEALRTLMSQVEAIINSCPLSADSLNDPNMPNPLTQNHLLTIIKIKVVLPPPGSFQSADFSCRKRWRRLQLLANEFSTRWRKEFSISLQQRQKWLEPHRNLCVGDHHRQTSTTQQITVSTSFIRES